MIKIFNQLSSQAWYFLTGCLGIFTCTIPLLFRLHDMGIITAFIGVGGPLVGVAAGGLQSDAKKTTTTGTADGMTVKTVTQTPSAPSDEKKE